VHISIIQATTVWSGVYPIRVLPGIGPVRPVLAPGLVVPVVEVRATVHAPGLVVPVVEVRATVHAPGLVVTVVEVWATVHVPGMAVSVVEVRPVLAPGLLVPVVEVRPVLAPGLVVPLVEVRQVLAPGLVVCGVGLFEVAGVTRVRMGMARPSCRKVSTTTRRLPAVVMTKAAVLSFLRRNLPPDVRMVLLPVTLPCEQLVGRRKRVPLRSKIGRFVATIPAVDAVALRPLVATVSPLVMVVVWRVPSRRRVLAAHHRPAMASPATVVTAGLRVGRGRSTPPPPRRE
jgi:di/tricarboxylate transporter